MKGCPKAAAHFLVSCSGIAAGPDAVHAGVAELVDALDLGSSDESCGGSSPSARTILRSADDLTAERSAASTNRTRRPHVVKSRESTACLSLALLLFRRRSGGTR